MTKTVAAFVVYVLKVLLSFINELKKVKPRDHACLGILHCEGLFLRGLPLLLTPFMLGAGKARRSIEICIAKATHVYYL